MHITDLAAWCNIDFLNTNSNPLYYAKKLYLNGELLRDLVIPNGVKEIKGGAFAYCSGLTSVTIPNSVTSIGYDAFYNRTGLTAVHITDLAAWCNINFLNTNSNPLYYAQKLYLNGEQLTDLVIPNGIKEIKSYAFNYCSSLKSVTIPNSVTTIGSSAFRDCTGLTSVTIPNSVTSIGNYAFYNCDSLASVTIPNSVTSIGNYAFYNCDSLASVTIPNSVTSIGNEAFIYCSSLTSITIPNSVTSIGNDAFNYCYALTSVEFNADNCTSMGSSSYPVFEGCNNLSTITIGKNVKTIPSYAFYGCTGLTSITIPNSVTSIGNEAFYGCTGLTSVEFNAENCTSMGSSSYPFVFSGCTNLSTITIGENVKTIPSYAFYGCTGLTEIYVKATTRPTISSGTFDKYTATLYVPTGTKAAYRAAYYWKNFTNIVEMDFAIKGDITGDESVDVSDLTTLVNMILDSSLSTDAADINGDGAVDVSDLTTIVNIILNPDAGDDNNDTTTDSRAVDLGLSVKWASCNVGATAPEEYGGYYAWGETEEKSNYSWSTYKYCNGTSSSMTKYCTSSSYGTVDNKTTLEASDDVATVKWGGNWRMPTAEEQQELIDKCTWTWTNLNGVNGYRVTGPNGNSIFLPAAGYRSGTEVFNQGSYGYYWSSSLDSSYSFYAYSLYFYYGTSYRFYSYNRFYGRTVRPVCE